VREERHVFDDAVEHVAVEHEIPAAGGLEHAVLDEPETLELERQQPADEIVVVAAQIDDLDALRGGRITQVARSDGDALSCRGPKIATLSDGTC